MGLGKTLSTLTAIDYLIYQTLEVSKVLVIAPLRVADSVWDSETQKWDHLKHLRVSKVLGNEKNRRAALKATADIYTINRENIAWLVGELGQSWDFDMIVIDELSSFKSHDSVRFKSLRQVRPIANRVVGLTGTPSPNSLIDLWAQVYLLDMGERLGKFITHYRRNYFSSYLVTNNIQQYSIRNKEAENAIYDKIKDICLSMKTCDYLEMPALTNNIIKVSLGAHQEQYETFQRELVLELFEADGCITVDNAAVLSNKLRQYTNGAIYDEDKQVVQLHKIKLDALDEILDEANGNPVLVFYNFVHDVDRIMHRFKQYKPRKLINNKDIEDWNKGNIKLLLAHPASCGHGLNLQEGGNIAVWFGVNWSLELYQQANARLYRQGQKNHVVIHHIIAEDTIDERVMDALQNKKEGQDALMDAVKSILKEEGF
jgi:SNF2 family DNA or RNA helicase